MGQEEKVRMLLKSNSSELLWEDKNAENFSPRPQKGQGNSSTFVFIGFNYNASWLMMVSLFWLPEICMHVFVADLFASYLDNVFPYFFKDLVCALYRTGTSVLKWSVCTEIKPKFMGKLPFRSGNETSCRK